MKRWYDVCGDYSLDHKEEKPTDLSEYRKGKKLIKGKANTTIIHFYYDAEQEPIYMEVDGLRKILNMNVEGMA